MSEILALKWINDNLGKTIEAACKDTVYDVAMLAGLTCRETGELIGVRIKSGVSFSIFCQTMQGDYTKRKHDDKLKYHGFGFTQIDIDAFPKFVEGGGWKDPAKLYPFSIGILEWNRHYLMNHFTDLSHDELLRAVIASYNCGAGNVAKALNQKEDVDHFTTGRNYSTDVFRLRELFKTKIENNESI